MNKQTYEKETRKIIHNTQEKINRAFAERDGKIAMLETKYNRIKKAFVFSGIAFMAGSFVLILWDNFLSFLSGTRLLSATYHAGLGFWQLATAGGAFILGMLFVIFGRKL